LLHLPLQPPPLRLFLLSFVVSVRLLLLLAGRVLKYLVPIPRTFSFPSTHTTMERVLSKTDHMFIVPERPGYGRPTYKIKYTVLEHADDVQTLVDYLGHWQHKTYGTSGGTPCALALNILAATNEVSGTLLVVPSSPPESPHTGQGMTRFGYSLLYILAPTVAEWKYRKYANSLLKKLESFSNQDILNREFHETERNRIWLAHREATAKTSAWVADQRAFATHWGFDLTDVNVRNIEIFAGEMNVNTPISGARWMRNRLRNCQLHGFLEEDHTSIQNNKHKEIMRALQNLHIQKSWFDQLYTPCVTAR
jgi:hypothetical protein